MKKENFVKDLYLSITKENEKIYRDLFNNTNMEKVTDSYWKDALKLYRGLSDDNKEIFFKIIKQIEIDAVANILGILDGVVSLQSGEVNVKVIDAISNETINGYLQDLFLEYDEEHRS